MHRNISSKFGEKKATIAFDVNLEFQEQSQNFNYIDLYKNSFYISQQTFFSVTLFFLLFVFLKRSKNLMMLIN